MRGRKIHRDAEPILICHGDLAGNGKEYRYPLGPGINCQMPVHDGDGGEKACDE